MADKPHIQDKDKLKQLIDEYFNITPQDEWTVTGLALYLDVDRDTLLNYQRYAFEQENELVEREIDPEIFRLIKRAKLKVENGYEIDLKKHGRVGTIFALKNFNWKDKQEIDANFNTSDISDEQAEALLRRREEADD
jgi:hypothetical protein